MIYSSYYVDCARVLSIIPRLLAGSCRPGLVPSTKRRPPVRHSDVWDCAAFALERAPKTGMR